MSERVVLVDKANQRQGTAAKLRAHIEGRRHRAFSVFVFDGQGRLLLQRRALDKYHSGGLWSNTCCSHPRPDEKPARAAQRRMQEEMGFTCPLTPALRVQYNVPVSHRLTEHEFNHVFVGTVDDAAVQPDPAEVAEWTWMALPVLRDDLTARPSRYTPWFHLLCDPVLSGWTDDRAVSYRPADPP